MMFPHRPCRGLGLAALVATAVGCSSDPEPPAVVPEGEPAGTVTPRQREAEEPRIDGRTLSELIEALDGDGADGRRSAAVKLGEMGPEAQPAVPKIARLLQDPSEMVRGHVAIALCHIGPEAAEAVPALLAVTLQVGDSMSPVEWAEIETRAKYARRALAKIDDGAIPKLIEALSDDDPAVQARAATLTLKDPMANQDNLLLAVNTLQELGAADVLRVAAGSPNSVVRAEAEEALGHLGSGGS